MRFFADELVVSVTAGDTGADPAFRDTVSKARPALEIVSSIAGRGIYLVRTASPSLLSPEQVAEEGRSYTGHYLKPLLQGSRAEVVAAPPKKKRSSTSMRQREAAE